MNSRILSIAVAAVRRQSGLARVLAPGLAAIASLAVATLISACAMGNQYDYRMLSMPLPVTGSGEIGLVVTDRRSYILSNDKSPDFVGLQRGGYGNPFDVRTVSGRSMTQDMAETLKNALDDRGFKVVPLDVDAGNPEAVGRAAKERGLNRVVAIRIQEWKTDNMMSTRLFYDVKLFIVDPSGKVLAESGIQGSDAIGGGLPGSIGEQARKAFEAKMGQLFYPPNVQAALSGGKSAR